MKACRSAANNKIKIPFTIMDRLFATNKSKRLWNTIKKARSGNFSNNAVSNVDLAEHSVTSFQVILC